MISLWPAKSAALNLCGIPNIPTFLRAGNHRGQEEQSYRKSIGIRHDLFVTMMAAAAATKTIKIGSGICLVIERDPIVLAKEVASVDQLSNGRVLFGIGGGWNAEEMENHGTPFNRRWKVLREKIEAMKEIWTKEEAEYHGEFVNLDPMWSYPKPYQKPYPPILLGTFNGGLNRVVNYCDGWIPVGFFAKDLPDSIKELGKRAEQAGKKEAIFRSRSWRIEQRSRSRESAKARG